MMYVNPTMLSRYNGRTPFGPRIGFEPLALAQTRTLTKIVSLRPAATPSLSLSLSLFLSLSLSLSPLSVSFSHALSKHKTIPTNEKRRPLSSSSSSSSS